MSKFESLESWQFRGTPEAEAKFLEFKQRIEAHQNYPYVHPLTCGVNSEHANLIPRASVRGNLFLLCPTCGYIQEWQ